MRFLLIVLLLLTSSLSTIWAQEPQDDPPDLIDHAEAFIALPSTIRLDVWVNAPLDQIQTVTLHLFQEDGIDRRIRLREDHVILDLGEQTVFEYAWDNPDEILLFQNLFYRFDVRAFDGITDTYEDDSWIEHQDMGQWRSAERGLLTLYWSSERFGGTSQVDDLADVLALIRENVDVDRSLRFVLYEPEVQFCQTVVDEETGETETVLPYFDKLLPCDPDAMFALYRRSGIEPVVVQDTNYLTVSAALTTALVNVVYDDRWRDVEAPAWFATGIGLLHRRNAQPGALTLVKRAAQERRLLTLRQLNAEPTEAQAELWRAQAYLLTLYLAESYGGEAPFRIAAAMGDSTDFSAALSTVTEDSIQRIYNRWSIWIETPSAAEAVLWHPYLPTTPTPTLTRTYTPVPPTHTPRPTATITLTPTLRPLRVVTTAAPNYIPPSPTVPPLPSPTPLPPGFFDTPAPTEAPTTATEEDNGGICGTGIGAIVLPIVGFVLARRKRR